MIMIKCEKCWKEIAKIWLRKYCVQCRKLVDKELRKQSIDKEKQSKSKKSI